MEVAKGMWGEVESTAKRMIASGQSIAPMLSPEGTPMFYVSTDKSLLRIALMESDLDGSKIYVGVPVGK